MTATLFITILYELIYITGVEKMTNNYQFGFIIAVQLILIALILFIWNKRVEGESSIELNCVNAGYTYVDKQCLDVKVIEL